MKESLDGQKQFTSIPILSGWIQGLGASDSMGFFAWLSVIVCHGRAQNTRSDDDWAAAEGGPFSSRHRTLPRHVRCFQNGEVPPSPIFSFFNFDSSFSSIPCSFIENRSLFSVYWHLMSSSTEFLLLLHLFTCSSARVDCTSTQSHNLRGWAVDSRDETSTR
jgi:hypothetical protein